MADRAADDRGRPSRNGQHAQLAGYTVFGKTGTAQKLDPETGTYSETKYVGSFLCGAPAADPRVLVLVVVDEPTTNGSHYGGTVAAPAAAEILRQTLIHLRVAPDDVRNAERFTLILAPLKQSRSTGQMETAVGKLAEREDEDRLADQTGVD